MATQWGDRAARRRDILRAGRKLLQEKGLAALQMREVARGAGIGLGTVYTYFPTKEALYAAMYADRLDVLLGEIEPVLASKTDLEELFVLVANTYLGVYAEFGKELDIMSVLDTESNIEPAIRDHLLLSAGRLLAVMQAVVARAGADEPGLALIVLWSTVTGLANHFTGLRHELHSHTWDDVVRYTARTFVRSLHTERQP